MASFPVDWGNIVVFCMFYSNGFQNVLCTDQPGSRSLGLSDSIQQKSKTRNQVVLWSRSMLDMHSIVLCVVGSGR